MKKSFNKVSIVLLVALVVMVCFDAYNGQIRYRKVQNGVEELGTVLDLATSAVWRAAWLGALAVLIEIIDQIRWHLKSRGVA